MRKFFLILSVLTLLLSCGTSKKSAYSKQKNAVTFKKSKQERVVIYARSFLGTRYKYGGVTKKGMDCSGLVYTSFQKINVQLPRVSFEMSKRGRSLKTKEIQKGDLVFFKTSKKLGRAINHVGVVSNTRGGSIKFIHSSSSKGVIESSLNNPYWKKAYKFARRVL